MPALNNGRIMTDLWRERRVVDIVSLDGIGVTRESANGGRMPVWLRAVAFLIAVPGTIAGWLPWYLAGTPPLWSGDGRIVARSLAAVVAALGFAVLLWTATDFVRRGRGTPAPYDPPRALVTSGLYPFTRNPMYVGVVTMIVAQALWFGSTAVLIYAAVIALAFHARVVFFEEPRLTKLFGTAYADYRAYVPRWLPHPKRAPAARH
jgi:protein-S-isoprenylcysteine O-methyltransferase Ste14